MQIRPCHRLEIPVDGKEPHGSSTFQGDEIQRTVRPVPEQRIRRGQ